MATRKQLENCRVDCDGVWFDDLDEGLELSGFFSPKKTNPIGRIFWLFPELNASAFVLKLWGENKLHLQRMNFIWGFYEKVSCYDGFDGVCCCRVR